MILQAAEKYNIDLSQSYMVGDDMRDVNSGINAGCIPVFLSNGRPCSNEKNMLAYNNLEDFVSHF
jgi:D-glycero-D-manno-heptose 1,7-bisphosphate phosphatase